MGVESLPHSMKPVAVLALVAAAVAALFFVLFGSPSQAPAPGTTGLLPGSGNERIAAPDRTTSLDLNEEFVDPREASASDAAREAITGEAGNEYAGAWSNGLNGVILDPDRVPLEGVRVVLVRHKFASQLQAMEAALSAQKGEQQDAWTTSSDSQGRFTFLSIPPSTDYTVTAIHPDFSRTERKSIAVGTDSLTSIEVVMSTGYQLRGRVMDDASGAPVAGAQLTLQSVFALLPGARHDDDMQTVSDESGNYRFPNVAPGTRNVTVTAEGYGSRTRNNLLFAGSLAEPQTQDFRLSTGLCLRGRVVAPDRTPIAGARIEATSYETAQISRGQGLSDKDGYFEICDLAEGMFMVIVRAKNFSDQRLTRVKLTDPDILVIMARQGGVMGTVVSRADDSIVTEFHASVRAVAPGSTTYGRAVAASKFKNEKGEFELFGLEAGSYVMQITAPGFAPTYSDSFVVAQSIVTPDVRVELGQGGSISGRVVDAVSGKPVSDALVSTFDNGYVENPFTQMLGGLVPRTTTDRKVRTDKDGAFTIKLITATTYQLEIRHEDYTQKTLRDLVVTEGQTRDLGSIRLPKGATIRGTVYGPSGAPLVNARISLTGRISSFPGTVRSDSEGRFVMKNVQAGTWQLAAVRAESEGGGSPFGPIIDIKKSEVTITVADGQDISRNLSIGN